MRAVIRRAPDELDRPAAAPRDPDAAVVVDVDELAEDDGDPQDLDDDAEQGFRPQVCVGQR